MLRRTLLKALLTTPFAPLFKKEDKTPLEVDAGDTVYVKTQVGWYESPEQGKPIIKKEETIEGIAVVTSKHHFVPLSKKRQQGKLRISYEVVMDENANCPIVKDTYGKTRRRRYWGVKNHQITKVIKKYQQG
ncbi:hypothetical protein LCGC14_1287570 [marine sediment metagenome]|uniref:Uncharacterized protein n=1 Tax=marine sediment metagenome TaxID=412755 RepID=A0A0F9NWC3_9ZZZZ